MTGQPDRRFLIVILIFGVVGTAAGIRWLSDGRIVIREGKTRAGVGGGQAGSVSPSNARVAGSIGGDDVLYYPLCVTWIALGVSMIALPVLAFFTSNLLFDRLSAYTGPAILLLAAVTVAAALWSGP